MTSAPDNPFEPVEPYDGLVLGRILSEHQGESRLVCLLDSHPGWIYKEYKRVRSASEAAQMDKLIRMPGRFTHVERQLMGEATSWPAARVTKGADTWGVIMPLAPDVFSVDLQVLGRVHRRLLNVDWLAKRDTEQRDLGIAPPSATDRVAVCASLSAVAALFERYGIVYLDWSFTNALWSDRTYRAYVIDIDGCTFGPRRMIGSEGWADPFFPMGTQGGYLVDRYRVALLVARCLTTERGTAGAAVDALARLAHTRGAMRPVHGLVARALQATRPEERPPLSALVDALTRAKDELDPPLLPPRPRPDGTPRVPQSFTPTSTGPPSAGTDGGQGGAAAAIVVVVLVLIAFFFFVIVVL